MNVARSSTALQEFIDRFAAACRWWGLTVSINKTQVMLQPDREGMASKCSVVGTSEFASIEGKTLEEVPRPVFKSKGLSVKAKLAIFKGAVQSSLLYGAETWAIKQEHLHY